MAAVSTVVLATAATLAAGATISSAVEARKAGKLQEHISKQTEAVAKANQKKQEALALKEKKAADTKLEEQRARILKGQTGKGGLLFGSELGVEDETKKTTLGA